MKSKEAFAIFSTFSSDFHQFFVKRNQLLQKFTRWRCDSSRSSNSPHIFLLLTLILSFIAYSDRIIFIIALLAVSVSLFVLSESFRRIYQYILCVKPKAKGKFLNSLNTEKKIFLLKLNFSLK